LPRLRDIDNAAYIGFARIVNGIDLLAAIRPGISASVFNAETVGNAATVVKTVATK
jgi:hypothetical protein